ncbi:MAG TPA: glycosyltransferase family 39 protein [Acidothermaceae bacterium]|nr:glycosyltransferase family 39 protein [Acidothermaceae bacterium]
MSTTVIDLRDGRQATRQRGAGTHRAPSRTRRFFASPWLWLPLICAVQVALATRHGLNSNAFEDEGLYVYTGHRMIQHLLHGTFLPEYPGAFFSGAPALYPVLAAMADAVGGLEAARDVSLFFAVVTTLAVYGIGSRLFGRAAGLIGASAFVLCGSVIYISHFATYDSMMMALVAVAAWLAVVSAQRDGFAWAPAVAFLLALAFLTKYAGAAYAPFVIALGVVVGWPLYGWKVVRRGVFAAIATLIMVFAAIELWGRSMVPGIQSTTSERTVLSPATPSFLTMEVVRWVGPWLLVAAIGALFRLRRQWLLMALLLLAAVVGPIDQIRIGEATSLAKHVAFGIVFAAPLIGDLFARGFRRAGAMRAVTGVALVGVLAFYASSGLRYSHQFLTGWVNDAPLRPVLARDIAQHPGQKILGERYSPQRYELRKQTKPNQWYDTYYFSYGGKVDEPAYAEAIDQHYFGVIYLDQTTPFGSYVFNYLQQHHDYYKLTSKVPRYLHGQVVGHWSVFTAPVNPPAAAQANGG